MLNASPPARTGWTSFLTRLAVVTLVVEGVTGLAITLAPFHPAVEWGVLLHAAVGLVTVGPLTWYFVAHWLDYKRWSLSDLVLLGYLAVVALLVCAISGLVVTWQGLFALRMSPLWRQVHLVSTLVGLGAGIPHGVLAWVRVRRKGGSPSVRRLLGWTLAATAAGVVAAFALGVADPGPRYENAFPADYSYLYGPDRPFAPSLARTVTGGALDSRSLSGSASCGSAGCHEQIYQEWLPSAHHYSAMDALFQKVQSVMAAQNGPESTRYCGGCHDPISLFSGAKNLFSDELTNQAGYQEGISCLACHSIRETDIQGNANYVMSQPPAYLWQWAKGGAAKLASDFLIRTYPAEHRRLSKRMYKAPEYCAACHKQFIDQEINRVGWVQLQNQYDNWKASHWFVEGNPAKTIECRECHMPLVDSHDPAAGDDADLNRRPDDGKHRSHRFVAANSMMPEMLKLPGWQKQVALTESWLQGRTEIPEIRDKWVEGPAVKVALDLPREAVPGKPMPVRVVLTANKVGHDFPTGPLDIIQSWVELTVEDGQGRVIFSSGKRDDKNFIEPGSFLFKAEPVDQYGNLIDRHNLWEMVGVRFRRALFPGYSDTVEYTVDCPAGLVPGPGMDKPKEDPKVRHFEVPPVKGPAELRVTARLMYRKVDQFLVNFLLGENSGVTAPAVEMTRATATVAVAGGGAAAPAAGAGG